jgi:Ca-activated chloride channel homolog
VRLVIRVKRASRSAVALLVLGACSRGEQPSSRLGATPADGDAVVVRISYGSEKKAFLTDSIEAFHRSHPKSSSGKPIRIEAVAEGSAESMETILAGRTDISVWSPASSLLVDVLNDRWQEGKSGLGAGKKLVGEAPPLVLSPVVIAMWEPMAKALGWPEKSIGWADVGRFAADAEGWARYDRPQWGSFKFGHTHPHYSNSGAIALVAATYAGAQKARDLQVEDIDRAAAFVKRVQSSVVHYGRSTGFFAEKMFTRGPAYLSAAVLYENLVVESSMAPQYKDKPFPVVAIYPKEGTFWSDHPYAILDLPTVTPEIRAAAEAFRAFLLSPERQKAALQRFGFRPADPAIPLATPLDAAHGIDPAQPQNVLPNPKVAVTRRILDTFEQVKRPVSITFVVDTSGSMNGAPLEQAKQGARVFLEGLPSGDVARVLFFSSAPKWHGERPQQLASARPALIAAVEACFAEGGTALYDAVREAVRPSPDEPRGAARAIIVLSDGEDTDSKAKLPDLLQALQQLHGGEGAGSRSPPRVFTIAYGEKSDPKVLQQIAEAGGGAFLSGTPRDIKAVYADLATFF